MVKATIPGIMLLRAATALGPTDWQRCSHSTAVKTTSGIYIGHQAQNRSDVTEYLGIRFAEPATDALRFAAPVRYFSDKTILNNATSYFPDCPALVAPRFQPLNGTTQAESIIAAFTEQLGHPQSEDCLGLNIWVKQSPRGLAHGINGPYVHAKLHGKSDIQDRHSKPVLLWIYGGRWTIGSINTPLNDGQYLASAEDIIVVTFNYRVGIFGFAGAPAPLNVGLLDQRLAIEWVRDNIASFGGDPSRIIIAGQSAGGVSVDYLKYSFVDDPIVAGGIAHSGTWDLRLPNNASYSETAFRNVSRTLGCNGLDDMTLLRCMRAQNVSAILSAVARQPFEPTFAIPNPVFQPTIDDKLVFGDYDVRAAAGNFAATPFVAGNCDYEAGYYKVVAQRLKIIKSEATWYQFNNISFVCPVSREIANLRAGRPDIPVWRYRYSGEWPNLELYPGNSTYRGSSSYHGSDVEMLFGTAETVSGLPSTKAEEEVSAWVMKAWAAFARDPFRGLEKDIYWPQSLPGSNMIAQIGSASQTVQFTDANSYDEACEISSHTTDPMLKTGAF